MRTRRFIVPTILLLALGAATSTAIAWGIAAFEVRPDGWTDVASDSRNGWTIVTGARRGRSVTISSPHAYPFAFMPEHGRTPIDLPSWSRANTPLEEGMTGSAAYSFGWPFHCLRYTYGGSFSFVHADYYKGGWLIQPVGEMRNSRPSGSVLGYQSELARAFARNGLEGETAVPLMPMWMGITGSSVFWATVWLMLLMTVRLPVRLRQWNRTRRGFCAMCRYSLHHIDSLQCPECGWHRRSSVSLFSPVRALPVAILVVVVSVGVLAAAIQRAEAFDHDPPLIVAAAHDDVADMNALLDEGVGIDMVHPDRLTAVLLQVAILHQSEGVVDLLLTRGADVTIQTRIGSYLHKAALWGNLAILRRLVSAGLDPLALNASGNTILHRAVHNSNAEAMVQYLIDLGVPATAKGARDLTVLHSACAVENVDLVRLLIQRGADVNAASTSGVTPLFKAVEVGNLPIVQMLLDAGADATAQTEDDEGLLHYYYWSESPVELLHLLIDAGACVDCAGIEGTPLNLAAESCDELAIRALIAAGASLRESDDRTPLHMLDWERASDDIIDYLLNDVGLDINARDAAGATPLITQSRTASDRAIKRMLDLGADPSLVDTAGHDAAWYARNENLDTFVMRRIEKLKAQRTSAGD